MFSFGLGCDEPCEETREFLGGKGYGLRTMSTAGIPVPPGFTIPCTIGALYITLLKEEKNSLLESLVEEAQSYLARLKEKFNYLPLFSVRSGARVSLPGMCDTILNVGLCDANIDEWAERLGERAAWDSYRRLIQMFGDTAMDVAHAKFEEILHMVKYKESITSDSDLTPDMLREVVHGYKVVFKIETGMEFPQNPTTQLFYAIQAVFESWNNARAIAYRDMNGFSHEWGTAVTIQMMVFGNMNDMSGSGVLFTRDPSTGENTVVGEFLQNAQGEDVVAGIRTPMPLTNMPACFGGNSILNELLLMVANLEKGYKDMQDVEFTIQDGKLYLLQTRNGKRSARATFKIAYDLYLSGVINHDIMVNRVSYQGLLSFARPMIDPSYKKPPTGYGIAAGGAIVSGIAVFSNQDAMGATEPCILVKEETTPDDITGMNASIGILTSTGGLTSHAAVVARGMDKTCVVGCTDLSVGYKSAVLGGVYAIDAGDTIAIDGDTGAIYIGDIPPVIKGGLTNEAKEIVASLISDECTFHHTNDWIPADTTVYVDTTEYDYIGDYTSMSNDLYKMVCTFKNVVVDFSCLLPPVDNRYLSMFGKPTEVKYKVEQKVMAITDIPVLKDNLTVVFPTGFQEEYPEEHKHHCADLYACGVHISGAANIKELLSGVGAFITDSDISRIFGDYKHYMLFKEMASNAGKPVVALSPPVHLGEYLFSRLG